MDLSLELNLHLSQRLQIIVSVIPLNQNVVYRNDMQVWLHTSVCLSLFVNKLLAIVSSTIVCKVLEELIHLYLIYLMHIIF